MALQTANQFNLNPSFAQPVSTGMQLGNQVNHQFNVAPKIEELSKLAASGDKQALAQLSGIAPDQAAKLQQFQQTEEQGQRDKLLFDTKSVIQGAAQAKAIADPKARLNFLKNRRKDILSRNGDASHTEEAIALYESGDIEGGNKLIDRVVDMGVQSGILKPQGAQQSAEGISFENLIANFSEKDKVKARRIKARLDPGAMGSALQTIAASGTAPTIADVEATIEGAKETSKLLAQKELKPEIEAAVISAVGQAKALVNQAGEGRSNNKALGVYETAMGNLTKALDNTITGPFIGFTPAMTSNAQIAEGAVAMMLPLMKDVFRSAGEGTFTDSDQKILNDLIPTRSDNPKARASKITMLDSMIRAKLKTAEVSDNRDVVKKSGGVLMTDANGNKAIVYPDGTFEEQ